MDSKEEFYLDYTLGFPVSQWFMIPVLERKDVPEFCINLLHLIRDEKQGAFFIYPNRQIDETHYIFIWQIPFYGNDYEIKLGISFDVDKESITNICGFAAYGDGSTKKGEPPDFSKKEILIFKKLINKVVDEALELLKMEEEFYHFIYYLKVPLMLPFNVLLKLEEFGLIIYPTVMMKKDFRRISAFIVSVKGKNHLIAKEKSIKKISETCMLLSLIFGGIYQQSVIEWTKKQKQINYINTLERLPTINQIYPRGKWIKNIGSESTQLERKITEIMTMYNTLKDNRFIFEKAITAYFFGCNLTQSFPTLAIVSFIAALSCFVKENKCKGEIICSECGQLKNFPHYLKGERASIIELIADSFNLKKREMKRIELI